MMIRAEEIPYWKKHNQYIWEINLCLREQFPEEYNDCDVRILGLFEETISNLMDDFTLEESEPK